MHDLDLPVTDIFAQLDHAIRRSAVMLQAPPGAGKSTALPLYLLQAFPDKYWILVQPRRLAALSIAQFLAQQLGEASGQTVGFQVRQQSKRSAKTRLLVVTEGILTRMLQSDPMLSGIDGVIFDEFHERNLHSDLGLALTLETKQLREDLALLVMSATLPAQALADWLASQGLSTEVLHSDGRQHAVDIDYQPPRTAQSYLEKTARVVCDIVRQHPQTRGILVFLPGQAEIKRVMEAVSNLGCDARIQLMALHGGLSLAQQQAVTAADNAQLQRVIFTTNIAETSLTIEGIDWVVDSGRERQAMYRPKYQATELVTRRIARAAATQRAGRAGRMGPGRCTRIYAASDLQSMAEYRPADIEQQDLTDLVLQVACWGSAVDEMAWFTPPNAGHVASAQRWLQGIGALHTNLQATAHGLQLINYAADTRYAQAFAIAKHKRSLAALCLLVAMDEEGESTQLNLSTAAQGILQRPQSYPRTWRRYTYWSKQLQAPRLDSLDPTTLCQAALYLYPLGLARQRSDQQHYTLATGAGLGWPVKSAGGQGQGPGLELQRSPWLLVSALSMHEKSQNGVIRQCLPLTEAEVNTAMSNELSAGLRTQPLLEWRSQRGGLAKFEQTCYHALELQRRPSAEPVSTEERLAALTAEVRRQGLQMLNWNKVSIQLQRRLILWWSAHQEDAPRFDDAHLLATLEQWAQPYWHALESRQALSNWTPAEALLNTLPYAQQPAFKHALPTHWRAPSGRQHVIEYQADGSAVVALKLQEMFGSPTSPTVLNRQLPLTLDLLSPAGRPLQRTQDLAGFWTGSYASVKKEMRGRYPKHPWPDDPAQAQATHLTKKAMHEQGK